MPLLMSAFTPKANIGPQSLHVRSGSLAQSVKINPCPLYPPKADICGATRDVRFVPIADITCRRMKTAGAFNGLPRELRTRHNIQPI